MSFSFYPATATPMVDNGETYTLIRPVAGFESLEDFNVVNRNARLILGALGIDCDEGGVVEIKKFAGLCSAWLQHNIGKRSAEFESRTTKGETGPTVIDGGLREGYLNEKIHQLAAMARTGEAAGATLMTWG